MPAEKIIPVNVIITEVKGTPAIELRKLIGISEKELIKKILSAAYTEQPIIILPVFSNKLISIGRMMDNGWVESIEIEDGSIEYKFLF